MVNIEQKSYSLRLVACGCSLRHDFFRAVCMDSRTLRWRIGCSGFHYADWKKIFYPEGLPQSKWFDYYCRHFNTLELNVTFYRFPQLKFLQNWHKQSPEGFNFSVKAPRLITHYKQFNDTKRMLSDFYTTSRDGLQEKLGCVLFQLPGRTAYKEETLQKIIDALDPAFRNVVEFRHESWWKQSVYSKLAKHGISFCGHSHPSLPDKAVCNTAICYYRFHGVPKLYYSQYKRSFLEEIASDIMKAKKAKEAYVYFNNTATIAAIRNAKYIEQWIKRK